MALYFRKVQARICLASLLVLAVTPSLAQDDSANTTSVADGIAPVDAAPAASAATGRTVYKSLDSKGMVTFTDTPPVGRPSEAIVVQNANTMPVGSSSAISDQENTADKPVQVKYMVVITSPVNDEFFGQDAESVTIAAQLEPSLQEGNTFQLYYDGKPVGDGGMSYTVTAPERGTHTVEAKVFDGKKKLLKAASPVQFTVRRISALNNLTATQPAKGDPVPAPPMSGFGGIKGVGSSGGSNSAGDAGSLGGAGSSGGANSPSDSGLRARNR
jgi:hypothetical protein